MTIHYIFSEMIWPSIRPALKHIQKDRNTAMDSGTRAGLNFCIILGSACYLEGVLETGLKAILKLRRQIYNKTQPSDLETRRSMNRWFNRMEKDTEDRICSAIGAAGYNEMFEHLVGDPLSGLNKVAPLWEGITVLFHLRNVLGHGREVRAQRNVSVAPFEEVFRGGYSRAESYLLKQKLISKKFADAHSDYIFLSDSVADYFFNLATKVPRAISKSLAGEEKKSFDDAVLPKKKQNV